MSRRTARPLLPLAFVVAAVACASVEVSERERYDGPALPPPGRILVLDFAATPADLPPWSEARARFAGTGGSRTPEEIEVGRALGARVAQELVARIAAMGLPAVAAAGQPRPRQDDIVLVGCFTSVDEGSALDRVAIGFGSGSAELRTHVEGYRMTDGRLRKLGSGTTTSGGGGTPGLGVPGSGDL